MSAPHRSDRRLPPPRARTLASNGERDFVGYAGIVPDITWPNGARIAVSIVLNYEEGAEAEYEDSDFPPEDRAEIAPPASHVGRNLAVESYYEYGSRVGVWRMLELFDEFEVPVTVFACARALERNAVVTDALIQAGHEICCHGYRWIAPSIYSRHDERESITLAVKTIHELTGQAPVGWYSRYGPSANTRALLADIGGFLYDSDSYAEDLPYYVVVEERPFLVIPYSLDVNDIKFWTIPGMSGISDFADYLDATMSVLRSESAKRPQLMSVGLHPRIIGRPGRSAVVRDFLGKIHDDDDIWFARREEIARWWLRQVPPS